MDSEVSLECEEGDLKARPRLEASPDVLKIGVSNSASGPQTALFRPFTTGSATTRSEPSGPAEGALEATHEDLRANRAARVLELVEARALLSAALDRLGLGDDDAAAKLVAHARAKLDGASR